MILSVIPAIKPLLPAPTAPQSIQKMRDWVQTTMARAGTSPSYLYRREMQPGEPVSLECSDFEKQRENSGKQEKEEHGKFEYDFPSDDGDIPSLELEAEFHLKRGSRFGRQVFNSTAELCSFHFSLYSLLRNHGIAVTYCVLCTC